MPILKMQRVCEKEQFLILFPIDRFHRIFKIICIQTKVEHLNKSGINEGKHRGTI